MAGSFCSGCDKRDVNLFLDLDHPSLPFGFKIGKIVKYTGPNSDQLVLVLGKNLARMVRPKNHGDQANLTTKSPDAYRRLVPRKWIAHQSLVNGISAEEMRTPRNKSKLMPGPRDPLDSFVPTPAQFQFFAPLAKQLVLPSDVATLQNEDLFVPCSQPQFRIPGSSLRQAKGLDDAAFFLPKKL
jgi:hypothetical protein